MGQQWVDAGTIRDARVAGIASAAALSLLVLASAWEPTLLFFPPAHPPNERMLMALLVGMPLSLGLALRDPIRNAGVFAVIGLGCGFLAMARAFTFVIGDASPPPWWVATAILFFVGVVLVVTYRRLRRPHPIIVRVVIAATAFMPAVLYALDWITRLSYER